MSSEPGTAKPTDNAFLGPLKGGSLEVAYAGALSFMRRRYSRDLDGIDVAVWGVPLDTAVSNRPGARFGPQAIRRASAILCGDPQYPFNRDPFAELAVVDYGDCAFDYGRHAGIPATIEAQARGDPRPGRASRQRWAAIISSPGPCCGRTRRGTARWRWSSSTRTRIPGTMTASGSTTAPSSPAPCAPALIDPARSIQVGIRTHAPEDCGIEIVDGYAVQSGRRRHGRARSWRASAMARPI